MLANAKPDSTPTQFAPARTALAKQHGWDLLWIGGTVATLAWPIVQQRPRASGWAFALAGLADVGYLGAFVIPGFVRARTWIAGSALWLAAGLFRTFNSRSRVEQRGAGQGGGACA